MPAFSGKNLPSSRLEERSYCITCSMLRWLTFLSMLPHPGVLVWPTRLIVPRSASLACICALAAQPPSSRKSARRSSLTHISADSGAPSSVCGRRVRMGFLTPTITTLTLLRLGLPLTEMRAIPSCTDQMSASLTTEPGARMAASRDCLASSNRERSISILFSSGQTTALCSSLSLLYLPYGVSFTGISYS
ncbi:MAG: hypothetical protein BWY89_00174 [Bacteroidetes bacterium ADurb.BinA012]|nr:MAG: hypothetical protein BWY89_00174 [Bacteroidetes bacterium ADurb.BinA012]